MTPLRLDRRFVTLVLIVCASGAAAQFAAPRRTEQVAISVTGDGAPAAAARLFTAASVQTDGGIDVALAGNTVIIHRSIPTGPLDQPAVGVPGLVAQRLVQSMRNAAGSAATVASDAPDPPHTDPAADAYHVPMPQPAADLVARRVGALTLLNTADQNVAALSAGITEITHALADAQRQDAASGGDVPARALLAQLQAHRIDLASRYSADYPGIAIADDEIAQLRKVVDQEAAGRPRQNAAIGTLRAEQQRLSLDLGRERARRDTLDAQLAALDAAPAAGATIPIASAAAAPAGVQFTIADLGSTTAADPRPAAYAAILLLGSVLWFSLGRRFRQPKTFSDHLTQIERTVRLPVLRCLDVHAAPVGNRLPMPAKLPAARLAIPAPVERTLHA